MTQVIIYTKSFGCPYCDRAKQLLSREGLAYQEIQVDKNPEALNEMITKSGGRRTVPQIFIEGMHRGGCDDLYAYYKEHGTLL
ncbi:MAG: glutaredoxin 3 [Gammaproteobacteria bacterium]|nr:glutaredoxin 3 [Gammaproteobacteria bacterium]MCD8542883.1 glutaredoxin 3 [Gammaproteobacteria bacterium]